MSRFYRNKLPPAPKEAEKDLELVREKLDMAAEQGIPEKSERAKRATEMLTILVMCPDGHKRPIRMTRAEAERRAMAVDVARRSLELIRDHHRTEKGQPVELEHQWKQIYADPSPDMRVISAAQKGKTLWQLVKTFAQLTLGLNVGWIMPNKDKVSELVQGKINPTITNTPLYADLQKSGGGVDSVQMKMFGNATLYVKTAESSKQLTSFSSDCMHVDERDFCNRENLPMYTSRMLWSPFKLTDETSTPTLEGVVGKLGEAGTDNIHAEFLAGDQFRYFSVCEHCGRQQIIDWYNNIVEVQCDESGRIRDFRVRDEHWEGQVPDIRPICVECHHPMDRLRPGFWKSLNPGATMRTYWVEALAIVYGEEIWQLVEKFTKCLGNPSKMQHFHNMDLGRPYAGGMMRFTADLFRECAEDGYRMLERSDGPCTIGIDVNRPWLDVHISRWVGGRQRKVYVAKMEAKEERLIGLFERFNIIGGVIDNQPETNFAIGLQETIMQQTGRWIVRCKYATNPQVNPLVISEAGERTFDPPNLVSLDRTCAIDSLFEDFVMRRLVWFEEWRSALDGMLFEEFHNLVRVFVTDGPKERIDWVGKPDHQLHAAVYDALAGEIFGLATKSQLDYSEMTPIIEQYHHGGSRIRPSIPGEVLGIVRG